MTTQHTKGPWVTAGYENCLVNTSDGVTLCCFPQGSMHDSLQTVQANASLIAAAPEFFDFVEKLLDFTSEKELLDFVQNNAENLLAKTRGEV